MTSTTTQTEQRAALIRADVQRWNEFKADLATQPREEWLIVRQKGFHPDHDPPMNQGAEDGRLMVWHAVSDLDATSMLAGLTRDWVDSLAQPDAIEAKLTRGLIRQTALAVKQNDGSRKVYYLRIQDKQILAEDQPAYQLTVAEWTEHFSI